MPPSPRETPLPSVGCSAGSPAELLSLVYVGCLRPFLALHDLELDGIAFLQTLVAFSRDGAVMDEHVWPVVPSNKAVTFCVIEPFHSTFQTIHVRPLKSVEN